MQRARGTIFTREKMYAENKRRKNETDEGERWKLGKITCQKFVDRKIIHIRYVMVIVVFVRVHTMVREMVWEIGM